MKTMIDRCVLVKRDHHLRSVRRLFTLALTIGLVAGAHAQLTHGPRFGLAMATQTAGSLFSWNGLPKLGPIAGWTFEAPWKRQVFFRVEPMLMSKGSWVRDAATKTNTVITHRFIELPLLVRLDMQAGEGGFFLTGGFVPGYWIFGRVRTTVDGSETLDITFDLSQPNVNRMQWSMLIGFGQQGKRWSWEIRPQQSITPFDRLVRSQNLVFGLHITYRLLNPEEKKAKVDAKENEPEQEERRERKKRRESQREDDIF